MFEVFSFLPFAILLTHFVKRLRAERQNSPFGFRLRAFRTDGTRRTIAFQKVNVNMFMLGLRRFKNFGGNLDFDLFDLHRERRL